MPHQTNTIERVPLVIEDGIFVFKLNSYYNKDNIILKINPLTHSIIEPKTNLYSFVANKKYHFYVECGACLSMYSCQRLIFDDVKNKVLSLYRHIDVFNLTKELKEASGIYYIYSSFDENKSSIFYNSTKSNFITSCLDKEKFNDIYSMVDKIKTLSAFI